MLSETEIRRAKNKKIGKLASENKAVRKALRESETEQYRTGNAPKVGEKKKVMKKGKKT